MFRASPNVMSQRFDERYQPKAGVAPSATSNAPKIACNDIMAGAIALVSDHEIQLMSRDDMLDTVRAAQQIPHSPARVERISELDENTLRRVIYLVRRWVRVRLNELSKEKGWTPYFLDRL